MDENKGEKVDLNGLRDAILADKKTTRAKFRCQGVEKSVGWGVNKFLFKARFSAVTGGDDSESKKFFAATPSGTIEVSTVIQDVFEPGRDYYVDFTPADAEPVA